MLILIEQFQGRERLLGGFENVAAVEIHISEMDETNNPATDAGGADLVIVDSKTGSRWMFNDGQPWMLLKE